MIEHRRASSMRGEMGGGTARRDTLSPRDRIPEL